MGLERLSQSGESQVVRVARPLCPAKSLAPSPTLLDGSARKTSVELSPMRNRPATQTPRGRACRLAPEIRQQSERRAFPSNENKMSDGHRERAWAGVEASKQLER